MTTTTIEDTNPRAVIGGNQPPEPTPFEAITKEIQDLFDTAKDFADGEPIGSDQMAETITELHEKIHAAGKRADALRVDEKKPLDDAVKAIQDKFNPFIQPKKGKVDLAKSALADLLTPWRTAKAAAAQAEARRIADEAAEAKRQADAAIQASRGNLAAREEAEAALAEAKRLEKTAKRADKAATTGTGLTTKWVAVMDDEEKAMDWCWGRAKAELLAVAQANADAAVRGGLRTVPGFVVREEKAAR